MDVRASCSSLPLSSTPFVRLQGGGRVATFLGDLGSTWSLERKVKVGRALHSAEVPALTLTRLAMTAVRESLRAFARRQSGSLRYFVGVPISDETNLKPQNSLEGNRRLLPFLFVFARSFERLCRFLLKLPSS